MSGIDKEKLIIFRKIMKVDNEIRGLNTWCHSNSVSFKSHSISVTFKFCAVLVALCTLEPHSTDSLSTQHRANFESHSNRVTFETNAIRMTSSIQALCISKRLDLHCFSFLYQLKYSEHFISYQYMFANAVSVESNRSTTMYLYCQTRTYIGTCLLFYVIVTCDI